MRPGNSEPRVFKRKFSIEDAAIVHLLLHLHSSSHLVKTTSKVHVICIQSQARSYLPLSSIAAYLRVYIKMKIVGLNELLWSPDKMGSNRARAHTQFIIRFVVVVCFARPLLARRAVFRKILGESRVG